MPENFNGQTYVAFSDLCGLKKMMNESRKKATKALGWLYQSAYIIQNDRNRIIGTGVDAIAVSDCIVSWARDGKLSTIATFLSQLHERMIKKRYLLRTTIAYDFFCYQQRLQLTNLQKAYIEGGAYVSAYLANEMAEPGMIILLKSNYNHNAEQIATPTGWQWRPCRGTKNWEYFWSARSPAYIPKIKKERSKAKNLEYNRLAEIYQGRLESRTAKLIKESQSIRLKRIRARQIF